MRETTEEAFLRASVARFLQICELGDGVLGQASDDDLFWVPGDGQNSIAIVVRHLHGNMLSRWTDFLTSDGEKPTRRRDREFDLPEGDGAAIRRLWQEGWRCCLDAVEGLMPGDVLREVTIRGAPLTVMEAILRQIAHYGYHVGQMVTLARQRRGTSFRTLSIARGKSESYRPMDRQGGIRE